MSEDVEIAQSVMANGWHAISVTDHCPEFVYTCGLMTTFCHPKAIILGLNPRAACSVLEVMVEDIRGGRSFASPGSYDGVLVEFPIAIRAVHSSQHELYLGYTMGHCRYTGNAGGLVAVQVFWPDKQGRFPFDSSCSPAVAALQPRLDVAVASPEARDEA